MAYDAPAQALAAEIKRLSQELEALRKAFDQYVQQHSMTHNILSNQHLDGRGFL